MWPSRSAAERVPGTGWSGAAGCAQGLLAGTLSPRGGQQDSRGPAAVNSGRGSSGGGRSRMRPTPAGGACLIWAVIGSLRFAAVAQEEPEPEPQPPTISDISFSSGSPLGAQRLGITGSGFTTNFHDGANTVEIGNDSIGWTECHVVEGACTVDCGSANRVVCDTEPVPESWAGGGELADVDTGPLEVKVSVCREGCDGASPQTQEVRAGPFEFTAARDSHTNPTLLGVHPRQLSADAALSLSGSRAQNSLFSPLASSSSRNVFA